MPTVRNAQIGDIPAIWAEPDHTDTRRLVIWLNGFSGTKEGVEDNLVELARNGFIGLSFDAFQHGERGTESAEQLIKRIHSNIRRHFWPILARTAEEVPAVIDWAAKELDVSPAVYMGGISMGGDISIAAAGLEQRIARVAAVIATPDWLRPGSNEPPGEPGAAAQACYDRRNPLTHLADYAHCPAIAFICGAEDCQVPPDGAERFAQALRATYAGKEERLEVTLLPGVGHAYPPEMWQRAISWFSKR